MTRTEILALSGLALREAVCERLGIAATRMVRVAVGMMADFPCVESSLDAARLVEDEVERRGLKGVYVYHLEDLMPVEYRTAPVDSVLRLWLIRRATPEQISRAALLAKEGL